MTNGSFSERGEGWVGFASVMMVIAGGLNVLWGISAYGGRADRDLTAVPASRPG